MKWLTFDQVVTLHKKLTLKTGGSYGIKDEALIRSALMRGSATFDGEDLYKSEVEKIAATMHSLISNHGFIDGNKRIGITVMLLLLRINKINIQYTQQELINLGLDTASGKYTFLDITQWIQNHLIK